MWKKKLETNITRIPKPAEVYQIDELYDDDDFRFAAVKSGDPDVEYGVQLRTEIKNFQDKILGKNRDTQNYRFNSKCCHNATDDIDCLLKYRKQF